MPPNLGENHPRTISFWPTGCWLPAFRNYPHEDCSDSRRSRAGDDQRWRNNTVADRFEVDDLSLFRKADGADEYEPESLQTEWSCDERNVVEREPGDAREGDVDGRQPAEN